MDKQQRHSYPEQHIEESLNATNEPSREYGSTSVHYATGAECHLDISTCTGSHFNDSEWYSAVTTPVDRRVSIIPAIPTVTFTLETPPRDLSVPVLNVEVSPANSCHSSIGPMCRICHEGDAFEELISPCRCTGSLALVHKGCLERWLNLSHCDKCELCCYAFDLNRTPRPFWQFAMCGNSDTRRSVIVDMSCFLILTPLAALSLYLCISSAVFYSKHSARNEKVPSLNKSEYWRAILGQSIESEDINATSEQGDNLQQYENVIGWDIIGLVMLAFLLIGIYLAWLIAAIIYHVKMWQRWRITNQDIVLAETQRRPSCFSSVNRSYDQMEEEQSPEIFTINIRSPVDLAFSPAARYLDRETNDILCSQGRDGAEYPITPAISEKCLCLSNIKTPYSNMDKILHPVELSDDAYDCVSLNDSLPKFNWSSLSLDESVPEFSRSFLESNKSPENSHILPSSSPFLPRMNS